MRMPTIERRRRPSNRRIALIALAAVVVVLLVSLRGIAGFYTDYLWFKELGYTDVWRGLLVAKGLPTAVFTVVFLLLILGNLIIADRLQPPFRPAGPGAGPVERVTPQVKARLSVLLGAMALLKAFGYWLQRFELNFSSRGAVQGASYTDVKAELPALNMLIVISVAAALLFFVNRWLKGWVLPIIAVGLWSFVSVVIGRACPPII